MSLALVVRGGSAIGPPLVNALRSGTALKRLWEVVKGIAIFEGASSFVESVLDDNKPSNVEELTTEARQFFTRALALADDEKIGPLVAELAQELSHSGIDITSLTNNPSAVAVIDAARDALSAGRRLARKLNVEVTDIPEIIEIFMALSAVDKAVLEDIFSPDFARPTPPRRFLP